MASVKRERRKRKRRIAPAICSLLGTLILIGVILVCLPLSVPRLLGYELFTVVSPSMEPNITVGSLICVKPTDAAVIQPDEVIAFESDGTMVAHRVVENHVVSGEFITKGDANADNDLAPISYAKVLGKVIFDIPELGSLGDVISTVAGKVYVGGFILAAALFYLLAARLKS